ncbi:MAG: hypothetical protein KGZ97_07585 [Bacteroidetes bacterium]|nr:hypothetical protein [Bacteroidota bacterium]
MKKLLLFCGIIILTLINSNYGIGQIYEPEGLNMPGIDTWTNPPTNLAFASSTQVSGGRIVKITTGTTRWQTIFSVAASGGDVTGGSKTWLFTSGPSGSPWNNKWAGVSVSMNTIQTYSHNTGADNTVSLTNGRWYTVNWRDNGYASTSAIFMETSANPVTLSSVSFTPENPAPAEAVTVTLTTSAAPSTGERVFVRYSTDGFSTSSFVQFSFSGTTGTATIPGQSSGTNVFFYVFSTTIATPSHADADMQTIRFNNNGGSNYSYSVIVATLSAQTGTWTTGTTWVGGTPPSAAANVIIKSGHTVTLNDDAIVSNITIESGATLVFQNGSARRLTIDPNSNFTNNGTLTHNDGVLILKNTTTTRGSSASQFNDVIIDGLNVNMLYDYSKINGTLEIKSGNIENNAPELRTGSTLKYSQGGTYTRETEWNNPYHLVITNSTNLELNPGAWTGDFHPIGGNLTIESGSTFDFQNSNRSISVVGNVNLDGTLILSTVAGGDLLVRGNWSRTGTLTHNNRMVTFNATSGNQTLTGHTTFAYLRINNPGSDFILNNGISITQAMYVENGASLNMGTQLIDGAGTFELVNGGILKIGHLSGITSSGATGNIQVTGTRTYGNPATYHYLGNGNQVSGNALPTASAAKNLIIELGDNANEFRINTGAGVAIAAGGKLEIRRGTFFEATPEANGRHVDGAGNLVMSGGSYVFQRAIAGTQVPRLTGTYTNTGGTIELAAAGDQRLNAGKNYYNLHFRGSGTVTIPNSTAEIDGTVTISDTKVVDAQNYNFGKAATNLTMTGGRLITSYSSNNPNPRIGGTYSLTGGTIEFSNNSATAQTVRNAVTYYNIDITGSNVGTSGGNFSIAAGGSFNIKSGGSFQIASNRAIEGAGSFIVEEGGTLLYGSALGITNSGATGNVRVTGSRTFNANATYGLIGGVDMVTGNGLPSAIQNFIIDKTGTTTATLSQNLEVTGTLTLTNRNLITGAHTLTLSNNSPAALVAGTGNTDFANSFIIGNFKRRVSVNNGFLFPVAAATSGLQLASLDFTALDTPGSPNINMSFTISTEEEDISTLGLEVDGTPLTHRLGNGFWVINSENISSFTANIRLTAPNTSGLTNEKSFAIIKRTGGGDWIIPPEGTHNNLDQSITSGKISVRRAGIQSFSDFAIAYNGYAVSLPIQLINFSAEVQNDNKVKLIWSTASEINNDYFTLLRSNDGINFEEFARIQGAGNSNVINEYNCFDNYPRLGINYYILKQTDFDGSTSLSNTIAVNVNEQNISSVFVLNGNLFINLAWTESEIVNYKLYDIHGRIILKGDFHYMPGHIEIINIDYLPKGLRIISIIGKRNIYSDKILIN